MLTYLLTLFLNNVSVFVNIVTGKERFMGDHVKVELTTFNGHPVLHLGELHAKFGQTSPRVSFPGDETFVPHEWLKSNYTKSGEVLVKETKKKNEERFELLIALPD